MKKDPLCSASKHAIVPVYMGDSGDDGWEYATFVITGAEDDIVVDSAIDGLCFEGSGSRSYCLPEGCYKFDVTAGSSPGEISWQMCGAMGGAPFTGTFCVVDGSCHFSCADEEVQVPLTLMDSAGDGWDDGSFRILIADDLVATTAAHGTLAKGAFTALDVCLNQAKCSYVMMEDLGSYPSEISFEVCDVTATVNDVVEVCAAGDGKSCSARLVVPPTDPTASCVDTSSNLALHKVSYDATHQWPTDFTVTVSGSSTTGDTVNVVQGKQGSDFLESSSLCLPDGCYSFDVGQAAPQLESGAEADIMWQLCGELHSGKYEGKLCVEAAFGFCYGLSDCPVLKSYTHRSAYQKYVMYSLDKDYITGQPISYYLDSGDIHGLEELCEMDSECFEVL